MLPCSYLATQLTCRTVKNHKTAATVDIWKTSAGRQTDVADSLRSHRCCTSGKGLMLYIYLQLSFLTLNLQNTALHHPHQELKVICCTSQVENPSSSCSLAGLQPLSLLQSAPPFEDPGGRHTAVQHLFWKSCSTTVESASVEMSPRSCSSQAILRSSRLMIFPDLVLGSPGAFWM